MFDSQPYQQRGDAFSDGVRIMLGFSLVEVKVFFEHQFAILGDNYAVDAFVFDRAALVKDGVCAVFSLIDVIEHIVDDDRVDVHRRKGPRLPSIVY